MSTQEGTIVISKSTKDRPPTTYQKDRDKNMIRTRNGYATSFKQVVVIEYLGKNKKGKKVFSSKTKHIPA